MSDNKKVSGSMLALAIEKMLDLVDKKADHTEVEKKANSSDLAAKQDKLTFDSIPTANSTNPITSGGVKAALDNKADATHIHDDAVTVEGGASLSMTDIFGEGPYVIEITEDEGSAGVYPTVEEMNATINTAIGDINSILDVINGEVV